MWLFTVPTLFVYHKSESTTLDMDGHFSQVILLFSGTMFQFHRKCGEDGKSVFGNKQCQYSGSS